MHIPYAAMPEAERAVSAKSEPCRHLQPPPWIYPKGIFMHSIGIFNSYA